MNHPSGARATHHFARIFVPRGGRMMGSGPGRDVANGEHKRPPQRLLTDAELVDDRTVTFLIGLLEVIEKATTTTDELEQTAAAVMILRVRLEVLGQVSNTVRQEGDLHLRRAGIISMRAVLRNQIRLLLLGCWQNPFSLTSQG